MSFHEAVGIVLGSLSILVILLSGLGWWINTKIKLATGNIHPNANGGSSLNDLHDKVDVLCVDMKLVKSVVIELEDDVDQLEADVEELINE
jgi:hypothetical protein